MEATIQGVATTSQVEENIVVESGDQFTSYTNPLAKQPPVGDTYFHGPVEGPLVENERLVTRRPKFLVTTIFFKG